MIKMDFLKRALAPITDAAFDEIKDTAKDILETKLTARKFIDVTVKGLDHSVEPLGRLSVPEKFQPKNGPKYGIHQVQPLMELRMPFELDIWELDNIKRGCKDIDLGPLEEATRKIGEFEEKAIYQGFEPAHITGLIDASEQDAIEFGESKQDFIAVLNRAVNTFQDTGIGGPYTLIVDPDLWQKFVSQVKSYPLRKRVLDIIDEIIFSPTIEDAVLVSSRGGDFELTVGQDYAIGYLSHSSEKVKLYLTESFTFRVLEPKAIISLKSKST